MRRYSRYISIDICDYNNNSLCSLYDDSQDLSGQAYDVWRKTQRNGFKELRFKLPDVCIDEELGEVKNYRIDKLISDYRIRTKERKRDGTIETDWFLLSEEKITHNFSKNYDVKCSHISQLLRTKNLDKEFSSEEGNNVGTIDQIAEEILEGTGWHLGYNQVAHFKEEDKFLNGEDKDKIRTFSASAKTGAFKMMSDLCDLFDAKVVYHGEGQYQATNENGDLLFDENNKPILLTGRTVEIAPMNPFSKDIAPNTIPQKVLEEKKVLELHYSKNVKNVTRIMKTENLVTKLSAYGSYGDLNGMASLQTAEHAVLTFENIEVGNEYKFIYNNANYYFISNKNIEEAKWSALDFVSRSYLYYYNNDKLEIIKVYKEQQNKELPLINISFSSVISRNYFPYVMDFSYYQKVGLLTDDMLKQLADFQLSMPSLYDASEAASTELMSTMSDLMATASDGEGYACLDISSIDFSEGQTGHIVINLNNKNYEDGIIYRSDYDAAKRQRFTWKTAKGIKANGEALSSIGSVIYFIRRNTPTKWLKTYIKYIGNNSGDYFYDEANSENRYIIPNKVNITKEEIERHTDGQPNIIYVDDVNYKLYIYDETYNDDDTWHYKPVRAANYEYGTNKYPMPTKITVWGTKETLIDKTDTNFQPITGNDYFFMFSTDSLAGMFGPKEDAVESNIEATRKTTQVVTEEHAFNILNKKYKNENTDIINKPETALAEANNGWCYFSNQYHYKENEEDTDDKDDYFKFGTLYFLWSGKDNVNTQTEDKKYLYWKKVFVSFKYDEPFDDNYGYYYNAMSKVLYRKEIENNENKWVRIEDTVDNDNIVNSFNVVVGGCINHEIYTKGISEQYTYESDEPIKVGNYAFKNEFNSFWLFTTDIITNRLIYITSGEKKALWQNESDKAILKPSEYTYDVITFAKENELSNSTFAEGAFNKEDVILLPDGDQQYSNNIYVYEKTEYEVAIPRNSFILFRNKKNVIISFIDAEDDINNNYSIIDTEVIIDGQTISNQMRVGNFTVPEGCTNIILVQPKDVIKDEYYIHVKNYQNKLFVKNIEYTILNAMPSGKRYGLPYLMDEFITLSKKAFTEQLPALQTAQKAIKDKTIELMNSLGDMYREGYWQEPSYVGGDESKLYSDALDNLKEISHPETIYEFGYLDLYKSDKNIGLSDLDSEDVEWPIVDMSYAAHLVDMDIDTNCWAYIDTIDECLDQGQKSTLEINTKLSNMGQQSFTDVLASIAQVSNEVKGKQTIYDRASNITTAGTLAAEKITGMLQTNRIYINSGTSNWYTDAKGNIIFEDANGESAMMLSGRGWAISAQKDLAGDWEWEYIATGKGLNASAIYTGYLAAERIEAGSITADKLSSTVGQDLEIGSNKALALYATKSGSRPAGAVLTKHESIIELSTGDISKEEPGYINVLTGGNMKIGAGGNLDIKGGNVSVIAENFNGWQEWQSANSYKAGDEVLFNNKGYHCVADNSDENFTEINWLEVPRGNGNINILAGGNINIATEGQFTLNSNNLTVSDKDQDGYQYVKVEGELIATAGNIGGLSIGNRPDPEDNDKAIYYMHSGNKTTANDGGEGVYIGSDGINIGGNFKYLSNGNGELTIKASDIHIGTTTLASELDRTIVKHYTKPDNGNDSIFNVDYKVGDYWIDSNNGYEYVCVSTVNKSYSDWHKVTNDSSLRIFECTNIELKNKNYTVGCIWFNTDKYDEHYNYNNRYVCVSLANKNTDNYLNDWYKTGNVLNTMVAGAGLNINADEGQIDLLATGSINLTAGSSINLNSGAEINIEASDEGTLSYMNLSKNGISLASNQSIYLATVNNNQQNVTLLAMGDLSNINSSYGTGFYLGTNGVFEIESNKFKISDGNVEVQGQITAESGSIGGWTIGDDFIGSGNTVDDSKIGLGNQPDYVFWAGSNDRGASSQFSVTPAGKVTCSDLIMTGGFICGKEINISASSIELETEESVSNWDAFVQDKQYYIGDRIKNDNIGYVAKVNTKRQTFMSSEWQEVTNHILLKSSNSSINLKPNEINIASGTSSVLIKPTEINMNTTGRIRLSGNNNNDGSYFKLYNGSTRVFEANSAGTVYAKHYQGDSMTITGDLSVQGTLRVNRHNIVLPYAIYADSGDYNTVKNKYAKPFFWVKPGTGETSTTKTYGAWASLPNSGDAANPASPVTRTLNISSAWNQHDNVDGSLSGTVKNDGTIRIAGTCTRVIGSTAAGVHVGFYIRVRFSDRTSQDIATFEIVPDSLTQQYKTASFNVTATYKGVDKTIIGAEFECYGGDGDGYYNRTTIYDAYVSKWGSYTEKSGSDWGSIMYIS